MQRIPQRVRLAAAALVTVAVIGGGATLGFWLGQSHVNHINATANRNWARVSATQTSPDRNPGYDGATARFSFTLGSTQHVLDVSSVPDSASQGDIVTLWVTKDATEATITDPHSNGIPAALGMIMAALLSALFMSFIWFWRGEPKPVTTSSRCPVPA